MPWAAAAGAVAGAVISGEASKKAAGTAASAQDRARDEQQRQFDVTQEQNKPWLEAGQRGLGSYEELLGRQAEFGGQIRSEIPGQFQSPTNIPQPYQSPTNIPGAYQGQAGDYFGRIESQVQPGFQFGREEFDQYKDPGYDFRREEGLRALERGNARGGQRNSGYNTRSLMELGQNLGSQEFGRARERAFGDYQSRIGREEQIYGRGVGDFGRRVGRESELYGRGRTQRLDEMGVEQGGYARGRQGVADQTAREREQYGRNLRDYGLGVEREQAQYGRDIEAYGRNYVDPLNRFGALSGVGQTTAQNLGGLRSATAQNIGQNIGQAGAYRAAGTLGTAGAYAGGIGALGNIYVNSQQQPQPQNTVYDEQSRNYGGESRDIWGRR